MNIYQEHGYKNRKKYLKALAHKYGIAYIDVCTFAKCLKPSEDFGKLLSILDGLETDKITF